MWPLIKILLIVGVTLWQFVIVMQAENLAEETGNYDLAIYESIWLLILIYLGDSIIKDNGK